MMKNDDRFKDIVSRNRDFKFKAWVYDRTSLGPQQQQQQQPNKKCMDNTDTPPKVFRILLSQIIYHDRLSYRKLRKAICNHAFPQKKSKKKEKGQDHDPDHDHDHDHNNNDDAADDDINMTMTYQDEDNDTITMNLVGDIYDAVLQFESVGSLRLNVYFGPINSSKKKTTTKKKKKCKTKNSSKNSSDKIDNSTTQPATENSPTTTLLPSYSASIFPFCGLLDPLNLREW